MSTTSIRVRPNAMLESAFPFHFAFDEQLRVTRAGKSLRKVIPKCDLGTTLSEVMSVERPAIDLRESSFRGRVDELVIFQLRDSGMRLRGQLLTDREETVFLGTPWQVTPETLSKWGLSIADFALHDSVVDYLFVQQLHSKQLADLLQMVERLETIATGKTRLAKAEQELEHDLNAAGDVRIRFAQCGTVLDARTARPEYLPIPVERLAGRNLSEAVPSLDVAIQQAKRWLMQNDQPFRFEYELPAADATLYFDGRLIGTLNGNFLLMARDITERRLFAKRLQHQSQHDPLTGLPNRSLFKQRLKMALTTNGLSALMFVDIDDFKAINDTLGHSAGDEVLQVVAARIQKELASDDTAARLGGDEFGVLLTNLPSATAAAEIGKRLIARVARPIKTEEGRVVRIAISIGLATSDYCRSPSELYRNADLAMYDAKAQSESAMVCFDPSLYDAFTQKTQLRDELVQGISRRELIPYYQPIIEFASGNVVGWEALARWNHPSRGVLSPGLFVPIAEESGLVLELGHQILERACEHAKLLAHSTKQPQPIHVNLSPVQIQQSDVVGTLRRILSDTGLPGHWLTLEITETSLFGDLRRAEAVIDAIRKLGVRIALDDFGVGYSSLRYLDRFQIDVLKLDRSFVSQVSDPTCRGYRLIQPIIQLGRALDLKIVAEGIETPEQAEKVREFGCHFAQGYLYGHPMPLETIPAFLEDYVPQTYPELVL